MKFENPYYALQVDISHFTLTLDLPYNDFYHVCNKRNIYKKLRHHWNTSWKERYQIIDIMEIINMCDTRTNTSFLATLRLYVFFSDVTLALLYLKPNSLSVYNKLIREKIIEIVSSAVLLLWKRMSMILRVSVFFKHLDAFLS